MAAETDGRNMLYQRLAICVVLKAERNTVYHELLVLSPSVVIPSTDRQLWSRSALVDLLSHELQHQSDMYDSPDSKVKRTTSDSTTQEVSRYCTPACCTAAETAAQPRVGLRVTYDALMDY